MKFRKTGWLKDSFHIQFREILLHALGRYNAVCPAYCLMPDHVHLLMLGWEESCDQKVLVRFLRKHTNAHLRTLGYEWQKQPYDNVLRPKDREKRCISKTGRLCASESSQEKTR
jgi:REP element-mobilizing transposase RayT